MSIERKDETAGAEDAEAAGSGHVTVLLDEAVDALLEDHRSGVYIDGTFGRGGHSRRILKAMDETGRLLGIDQDPEACAEGARLAETDARFVMRRGSFTEMGRMAEAVGWPAVDGILLDLGVSSPQLDDPRRGFSFMRDGPLDMRMDPDAGKSAAQWLASADEQEIAKVLWTLGEEKFSRRIARHLVQERQLEPIVTTSRLAKVIAAAVPVKDKFKHPATRSFQAIRIFINRELEALESVLTTAAGLLKPGGRLVVISFHSLEDRIVKRFMRDQARGPQFPRGLPVRSVDTQAPFDLGGKAAKPSAAEVSKNVRSRSAVLRVLKKRG